jgi:hypothetical protein
VGAGGPGGGLRGGGGGVSGGENFRTVHTDHAAHPDFCAMGTGLLPGVKPPECSADHGLLATRLRMGGAVFLSPLWACPGISRSGLYLDLTL